MCIFATAMKKTNYFGDLIRQMTDDTAGNIIRRYIMSQAQKLLISGTSITSTANQLGFEYPQHFTRMFKKHFGESPSQYVKHRKTGIHAFNKNICNEGYLI